MLRPSPSGVKLLMTTLSVHTAHVPQHFHSMHAYPNVTLTVTHVGHLYSLLRLYHSTISNSSASSHHQSSSYHHPTWWWWSSSSSSSAKTHLSCCCNSYNHFVKAEGVAHQIITIIIVVVIVVGVAGIILADDGVVMAMTEQLLDQALHKRLKSNHQVNLLNECEHGLKKICTKGADRSVKVLLLLLIAFI